MKTLTDRILECLQEWKSRARIVDYSLEEKESDKLEMEVDLLTVIYKMRGYSNVKDFMEGEDIRKDDVGKQLTKEVWDTVGDYNSEDLYDIIENSLQNISFLIRDSKDYV